MHSLTFSSLPSPPRHLAVSNHSTPRRFHSCSFLRFGGLRRRRRDCEGLFCYGRNDWNGNSALEADLLKFMKNSENPGVFPSKKELVSGGRRDLAEAIVKQGGWLSMGWDLNKEDDDDDDQIIETAPPSLSNGSIQVKKITGIEGILERLEEERNLSFGIKLAKNDSTVLLVNGSSTGLHKDDIIEINENGNGKDIQTGLQDIEIELSPTLHSLRSNREEPALPKVEFQFVIDPKIVHLTFGIAHLTSRTCYKLMNYMSAGQYDSFSAILKMNIMYQDEEDEERGLSCDDWQELSDAYEFQENEMMNAQDKLRSLFAKLAVLEGKTTLAFLDAQKVVLEKQRKVDNAKKAVKLIRSTCIVWPNSAFEVLLTGSFDGWTTQRRMERTSRGDFSIWLKLYPGNYEIKFFVDNEWRIDPLRPTVYNDGYQNNLLIVT
ncbi:protein FLOURY ENDOSPERM 6, chloroplastic-like [Impatiens glandulifera]|uniref:protein FLOURY ENDOSPERM 6, chloroplastic-like n=1 Tax=Impatiens glandulifera TaxID=253017 RepID=UPI001FB18741|nr:protein FLOURY ENDOSPERM 6, chloroplastic-like [Impatiens glandulifera]